MARRAAAPYSAYSAPKPWKSASGVPSYRGAQADPPSSPPPASFCGLSALPQKYPMDQISDTTVLVSAVFEASVTNYQAQYKLGI